MLYLKKKYEDKSRIIKFVGFLIGFFISLLFVFSLMILLNIYYDPKVFTFNLISGLISIFITTIITKKTGKKAEEVYKTRVLKKIRTTLKQ